MRWIGYILGALVLLVVVAVLVVVLMPTGWIVERAETYAAEELGLELDIGGLELELLSWTPGASVTDVSLGDGAGGLLVSKAAAYVSIDAGRLIGGELVIDELALSNARIELSVDENGRGNWEALLPDPEDDPPTDDGGGVPAIRSISIENVHFDFTDVRFERALALEIAASGSTTDAERPTVFEADGSFGDVPLDIDVELASLGTLADSLENLALDATVVAGDVRLAIDGTVGQPTTLGEPQLDLAFSAPNGKDMEALVGIDLPPLPSMELTGNVVRDGADFVLRRFDARLGENALEGDVRVDPSTWPPTLYANVIARRFDLDAVTALLEDGAETEVAADDANEGGSLLPVTQVDLSPIAAAFDGAVRIRVEEIVSAASPLDSLDLRLESEGTRLTLTPEIGLAGGEITGDIAFDTGGKPPGGTLELAARGIELNRIVAALGIDDDSFGKLGGRAKYWLEGDTLASLAAGADGGLYLAMNGGKLDALLVELSGIDLIESIVLLVDPDKTTTAVDCGYVDLQTEDGVTDIATFVLESADTVYVADGTIDLGAESLDVTIEPHPRDSSLLAATTSVNISGTFGDPSIVPGGSLGARAVIAATLAAVAAPAAALLAFVDAGDGEDSPYCKGLVDALPDSR